MRKNIKSLLVTILLILSVLIGSWNFDLCAKSSEDNVNNTSISRSNKLPRDREFDWGSIEVISEPILGQNNNINWSDEPKIAIEDDRIYVVWTDITDFNGAGSDHDIFYKYFDGVQWSEIQVISEPVPGQNFNIGECHIPDITVDNGKIYVVWYDLNNTNNAGTDLDIFYRCNLTGSYWEDIQVISEPVPGQNFNTGVSSVPKIEVENGNIYVVWQDNTNMKGAGPDIDIFLRSNLTGSNWEDIQVISEPDVGKNFNVGESLRPAIAVENSRVYVAWDDRNNTNSASSINNDVDIFSRCYLKGNWEDIQVISEPIIGKDYNTMESKNPAIAVENSNIYVVWEDENNTNGAGTDWDIFYRCNITGSNWENVQAISEPVQELNLNNKDSYQSEIAVENGRIHVVWYDSNNTNDAGGDDDIFYRCNLTGSSWEETRVISERVEGSNINKGSSYYPDIVLNLGKSHIVWSDRNNTTSSGFDNDIFYRWIEDPSPLFLNSPSVSPIIGNTSTEFNFTVTYFNYDDKAPAKINAIINDTEYSMSEVDSTDTNYIDGKEYFVNIKNFNIGVHRYQFQAIDGVFNWKTLLIQKPLVNNTPPKIITEDIYSALEDAYYEVTYEYKDIDRENVGQFGTWEFSTNADWLNFNTSTQILNGTPTNADIGEYWVNISISDAMDFDYASFIITVLNVNDRPNITTQNILLGKVGELYSVDYVATDIDSPISNQTWFLNSNASWLQLNSATGVLSGLPTYKDVGWYNINVTVDDGDGGLDWREFILNIIKRNEPPEITTQDNLFAIVNITYKIDYNATDDRTYPDNLSWSLTTNAEWLTIDSNTGVLSGTPKFSDISGYLVNISVSDLEGGWGYHEFILQVIEDPSKNRAPDLTNPKMTPLEGDNETEFKFSIHYYDKDGDPPSFIRVVIDGNGMNMTLQTGDESNGTYILRTRLSSGIHTYYFTAFDGLNNVKTDNYLTSEIKKVGGTDTEESSWYWLIWLLVILIIVISLIVVLIYTKRKAKKIPTYRAELILTPPTPKPLSGTPTLDTEIGDKPELPTPISQTQAKVTDGKVAVPALAPKFAKPVLQLPQATLSKIQKLNLLQERFLRSEVDLETYKELKAEIEGGQSKEVNEEE